LANALSSGQLGFAVTSMHATGVQGLGEPFPNPATANHFAFDGPVLTLDIDMPEGIVGDFDGSGVLDAIDIDLLSAAVREMSDDSQFDLNADSLIDNVDRTQWIESADSLFGDADLNGEVAFADFLLLSRGFGSEGGWTQGDFDGTGDVAFADFLLLSQNFGKTVAAASVPEPVLRPNVAVLLVVATLRWTRKRREG